MISEENRKRCLCVYTIYQKDGILEDYILNLVKDLNAHVSDYIFVINGEMDPIGINKLKEYGRVIRRENEGYDAGAYKQVFIHCVGRSILAAFDQLILMNDSFCGGFAPWEKVFYEMGKESIDFWGLTRWKEGFSDFLGKYIPEHVQSYFMVFNKNVISSKCFEDFWLNMDSPKTYSQAIENFEVAITCYLSECGFRYSTWLDKCKAENLLRSGETVYISNADILIREYAFPVLKKKACNVANLVKLMKLLDYISENECKDVVRDYIFCNLRDMYGIDLDAIESFYYAHENVYLYGGGVFSNLLRRLFEYRNWNVKGIIVSNNADCPKWISIGDLQVAENTGIIIATSKKYTNEILSTIREVYPQLDVIKMCN